MATMRRPALILFVLLAACARPPALDARLTEADRLAPYPAPVPLGPLLALADAASVAPSGDLSGRIAALAARAGALRGPVIDPATTARMQASFR